MLVEFVPSGSFIAVSNLCSAGNVSEEFPKEGLLGVTVGMVLVSGYVDTGICHVTSR